MLNPNYLSDYEAYTLGLSLNQINKLREFRASDRYVNSPEQLQQITRMPDSTLQAVTPLLKFSQQHQYKSNNYLTIRRDYTSSVGLNEVDEQQLVKIHGIGKVLAKRIVKFRESLGGFVIQEQLSDVYGLSPEVVELTLKRHPLNKPVNPTKLNVNTARVKELAAISYISYRLAKEIVEERNLYGSFENWQALQQIEGFPKHKIDRIKLYLYIGVI